MSFVVLTLLAFFTASLNWHGLHSVLHSLIQLLVLRGVLVLLSFLLSFVLLLSSPLPPLEGQISSEDKLVTNLSFEENS